jgi:DNA-binding GntR family transcriptional regulator
VENPNAAGLSPSNARYSETSTDFRKSASKPKDAATIGTNEEEQMVRLRERPGASSTRSGAVYEELRRDILAGRLKPGSKLPFAALAEKYGCSMGSVREALQRLAEQGLVESIAQQGFRVVSVSVDDLIDLTAARCEIEALALQYAIADGDVAWEGSAVAALHILERIPQFDSEDPSRQSDEWAAAHDNFHLALLSGCKNRRILATAIALRDAAELYRRWSAPLHDRHRDVSGEHRAMLDAAVGRRADEATEVLRAHIQRTTDKLLPALAEPVL